MSQKRLNVLLVSPWSYPTNINGSDAKLTGYRLYPFSIVYLVNYLRRMNACDVDYVDLVMISLDELEERIQKEHFDLIGFTSTTEARFTTIEVIKRIKACSSQSLIVGGGSFFGTKRMQVMNNLPEMDFVVYGEGEITLLELVRTLSQGQSDFASIPGLVFRDQNGQVIENEMRPDVKDIEELKIDYDLIHKEGYDLLFPLKNFEEEGLMAFPLMLGRGCNQKCIFCVHRLARYRVRKMDSIIADIDWAMNKLGTKYFMFTEPSFCERRKFVEEFCHYLIDHNYNIKWYCEGRVDTPIELLRLMAKAGCISMDYALESGSDEILNNIGKKIDLNQVKEFSHTCRELGIRSYVFSMFSLPGETKEDLFKTEAIIKEMCEHGVGSAPCGMLIYPGTPLENLAIKKGVLPADFNWMDPAFETQVKHAQPRATKVPHYQELLDDETIKAFLERCRHYDWVRRQRLKSLKEQDQESHESVQWFYTHAAQI